ncbi:MAG: histidine kinase N-terminal 7TM domain-containing protein, partial [Candidatus Omnitrophota bacterium]|nr:histidine kinase N-terminal 7TM domain-containing protein [Candidatus Omnitrophota bacterium]
MGHLTLFSISGLFVSFTCFVLTLIINRYGKTKLHRVWSYFNFAVGVWGIFAFFIGKETNPDRALIWLRLSFIGTVFIPVFLFHSICLLCDLSRKKLLFLIYLQGVIFLVLSQSRFFVSGTKLIFSSFYYTKPGFLYHPFLVTWLTIVAYGHYELLMSFFLSRGIKRNQILYLFFGTAVGFSGGITNFFPIYNINIYPFGNFMIALYCIIVTYAIIHYRLMDINIVITRTGVFVAVYSIVLGIPFVVAYTMRPYLIGLFGSNWWIAPLALSTFLATAGPFIYLYIQRRAEDRLLREQRRYQSTLRQASIGMTRIRDLQKLLN